MVTRNERRLQALERLFTEQLEPLQNARLEADWANGVLSPQEMRRLLPDVVADERSELLRVARRVRLARLQGTRAPCLDEYGPEIQAAIEIASRFSDEDAPAQYRDLLA